MSRHDRLQTLVLFLVLVAVLFGIVHTSQKIGERNLAAGDEVDAFKRAVREEIESRFRVEQSLAQVQRDQIHDEATEAKQLATKALTSPKSVVLTVKTPLPVIVTATAIPTPADTPRPKPTAMDTHPKRGLLELFR